MGEIPIPTAPFCCELKSAINKEAERKKKKEKGRKQEGKREAGKKEVRREKERGKERPTESALCLHLNLTSIELYIIL